MKYLILLLLLISCGARKKKPVIPVVISQEMQNEIDRITPLLYWCDGQASGSGSNNVDHRPRCDVGDGAIESGFLTLVGQFNKEQIFNAMKLSFAADDQPFRAPSYVNKDGSNEFSRDQFLGFIMATAAGLPGQDGLQRALNYYQKTGKLCPNPTDNRCNMSLGLRIMAKYALKEPVSKLERTTEAVEIRAESLTVPMNYQADLVMKKIFTMVKLNKLTTTHKAPNNIWFRTVYKITNKGTKQDFDDIATALTSCMKKWNQPGDNWQWSKGDTECSEGTYGHDLVAVAHLLLHAEAVTEIEDNSKDVQNFVQSH
jgi:hypothetical protein